MTPIEPPARITPLVQEDLQSLRDVIDATGLFPGELLSGMAAGFLAGGSDSGEFWLTLHVEGPVGIAYCAPERLTDRCWNLLLIAVHPEHQGKGLGSRLQRAAEQVLIERGQRLLLVETSGLPAFEATRAFYRKLGYTEEARLRDYYADGDDKVVFWKRLG